MYSPDSLPPGHFEKLEPGIVSVGAPVLDGSVQIDLITDLAPDADFRKLRIEVAGSDGSFPHSVAISREDGVPIQIEHKDSGVVAFDKPVERIIYARTDDGTWSIGQEILIVNPTCFELFSTQVWAFALKNQRENRNKPVL